MAEYHGIGEAIECKEASIYTRKFARGALRNDSTIGRHIRYLCTRNGDATIDKELTPKESIIKKDSNLDLGDKIKGERILVLVQGVKMLKIKKIGGHTGRHSTQHAQSKSYTFSEITKPFENIINSLENRKKNLTEPHKELPPAAAVKVETKD